MRLNTRILALREIILMHTARYIEPILAIIDEQSIKTTTVGGDVGFDAHKQTKGRKRHILFDILGLLLVEEVIHATVQDENSATLFGLRVHG